MNERESFEAHQEAMGQLVGRPDKALRHADVARTYLAGLAYSVSHRRPAPDAEAPQPVDEPAPPANSG